MLVTAKKFTLSVPAGGQVQTPAVDMTRVKAVSIFYSVSGTTFDINIDLLRSPQAGGIEDGIYLTSSVETNLTTTKFAAIDGQTYPELDYPAKELALSVTSNSGGVNVTVWFVVGEE